jgi:hypothetical protein
MFIAAAEYTPAPLTIVAAEGGRHSLELRLHDGADGGSFTLRFEELRAATERDRKQAEGEAHLREGQRLLQLGAWASGPAAADQAVSRARVPRQRSDNALQHRPRAGDPRPLPRRR